jgi:hopene-associated glycosyltransferase HpnB
VIVLFLAAFLSCAIWGWLLCMRSDFWRADQRLPAVPPECPAWPAVVAVVPARNEAATIAAAVGSLLGQDYPGGLRVVVVDDHSDDGTADNARAGAANAPDRLTVVAGTVLPAGWTGKLWAVHQGLAVATRVAPDAVYALLTDADIVHDPLNLRRLVAKAEVERLDLVSLMVLLHCRSFWERLLIPAFVFFFQKLYPFPRVNDPKRPEAAAAGGCMLVRRRALEAAGGVAAIRDQLIDDCALAGAIKCSGPIWLGLTKDVRSLRAYESLGDIWRMVARAAFTQLDHSWLALAGTVAGMTVVYMVPPLAVALGLAAGDAMSAAGGSIAWLMMALAYWPTLRLYGLGPGWAFALPAAGFLYTLMTLDAARRHWQGRGGAWKGRHYGKADAATE